MNIVGEQGSLSSRFPAPMSENIHCKFYDRLMSDECDDVTIM